jgi:ankyrin repeat protein
MSMSGSRVPIASLVLLLVSPVAFETLAQTAPSASEVADYQNLHAAAHRGDLALLDSLLVPGAELEIQDSRGRTPLHVAAFASHEEILHKLAEAGADLDALEAQAYDVVTIAAVANDIEFLDHALTLGASAANVTSPYRGTALIAAAHLGHADVVQRLIEAGAPLDHINNLGWTALIEAVVLGDGGPDHIATVAALVSAGANRNLTDRDGVTPLEHARALGYVDIIHILERSD